MHTVLTKSGAKNPTRPTNVSDARKLGLLPSVTSILRMAQNDALERWKLNELAKVCFDRPAFGEEDLASYTAASIKAAFEGRNEAAELGTSIHAAIEQHYKGGEVDPKFKDYVTPTINAVDLLGLVSAGNEVVSVNNQLGYAGTIDMAFTQGDLCGILDFKSTKTKAGEPIPDRITYSAQLAAYHVSYWANGQHYFRDNAVAYNVFISTTELGRVDVRRYDATALRKDFEWFLACQVMWRMSKEYDPRS